MRRRYKGAIAAVVCGAGLFMGSMKSPGEVYVADTPYDWEDNADSEERYDRSEPMEEAASGPGVVPDAEDPQTAQGPLVTQVSLTERYHDEYQVYEESINNRFFFYTSVSNGGITDKTVTMDIPQNVFCTVEKDGAEYNYTPGQSFSEHGTYVVKITAVEDTSVPFSEQEEYRALFRFRIQSKPPQETEAENGLLTQPGGGAGSAQGWQGGGIFPEGRGEQAGESQTESGEGETESPQPGEGEEDARETAGGETSGAEETGGEEASEDGEEENGAPDAGEEALSGSYSERTQAYDSAAGRYLVTFQNGRTLTSNVPEGYMGPSAVELSVSEGEAELYRDDEPVEYTRNMSISEPGYYRLDVDGQIWSFTIASAVNRMEYYLLPAGMEVTGVSLDGEALETPEGRYVHMKDDGQYRIAMAGKDGDVLEAVIRKDTEPPQFSVDVKGGTAHIQYLSEDIARTVLEKNGEVQEGFSGYAISSPGSYRLSAVDEAGNVSSVSFTLKYKVNKYGIAAVVLVILLLAGGAVFVIRIKKTVKVR